MIGTKTDRDIHLSDEARAEEMLRKSYLFWRDSDGTAVSVRQICADMNLTDWEYKRIRALLDQDALTDQGGDPQAVVLTEKGMDEAYQLIQRSNYVSAFLKAVCNLNEDSANRNADLISRTVSDDVLEGIRNFMLHGHLTSRIVRDRDLNLLYEPGEYTFDMSIYETGNSSPRVLSEEYRLFRSDIKLIVTESLSCFSLRFQEEEPAGSLWYLYGQKWLKADPAFDGCLLSSNIFTYTINSRIPVISGVAYVAFVENGSILREEDIRELEVHLW